MTEKEKMVPVPEKSLEAIYDSVEFDRAYHLYNAVTDLYAYLSELPEESFKGSSD